jgi:DNA-binding transcriptional regulator YiaG
VSIKDKMKNAKVCTWFNDHLTYEERETAKKIAHIAVAIQLQRKAMGYTQKSFAKKLGVSQTMVSRWETGEENFTIATLIKITSALGIELNTLLGVHTIAPLMVACPECSYISPEAK